MKSVQIIAVVVCLFGHWAGAGKTPEQGAENDVNIWGAPTVLGVYRGKQFAAGPAKGHWHYAIVYCYRKGYIPVIIEDREDLEWVAVHSAQSGVGQPSTFWTSGSDFPVSRVFTWSHTRSFVNTTALGVVLRDPRKNCLAIDIIPKNTANLYEKYCLAGRAYPLCEKRVSV